MASPEKVVVTDDQRTSDISGDLAPEVAETVACWQEAYKVSKAF